MENIIYNKVNLMFYILFAHAAVYSEDEFRLNDDITVL